MSSNEQDNQVPLSTEGTKSMEPTVSFRRILVPLDGSHLAEAILPVVTRLADACGATIVLLHIIERNAPSRVHGERHLTDRRDAEAYLAELTQRLGTPDRAVEWHFHEVPVGDVAASIGVHAEEHAIDLVAMSTHGQGGIREVIWGSIAQQTLQHSPVPVLLVRANASATSQTYDPRTIMVTLDATAAAEAALPYAVSLARNLGAQLRLVVVVATPDTLASTQAPTATLLPSTTRALLDLQEKQAVAYLERLADWIRATGVDTIAEVRRGDAVAQLAIDAGEHDDGLVVAATHGRAGLQAIWSPGVAARLLRRTRAPVLLVPIVERGEFEGNA